MNQMNFTTKQLALMDFGKLQCHKLQKAVSESLGLVKNQVQAKRHTYIVSSPGLGKTFTVNYLAEENGIKVILIRGAATIYSFMQSVATAAYAAEQCRQKVTVWIDDCDALFMDAECLNVLKGAMDEAVNLVGYHKDMSSKIELLLKSSSPRDNFVGEAMRHYQAEGCTGVDIPTDNIRFIVTSNKDLTAPSAEQNTAKKKHEAAIRSRVSYKSFEISLEEQWGWVAYTAMNANVHTLTKDQKTELLSWMFKNLKKLPEVSMRSVMELGAMMLNTPDSYQTEWALYL
jgi:hypothetical protein